MNATQQKARRIYMFHGAAASALFWMVFTASNLYRIQTAGLDALQLVLTGTVLELSVFLFEIPTGVVADVTSRKLSVIFGTILVGAGFILEASRPLFGVILAAQAVWGLGYTFTSGALQAWITDEIGEEHAAPIFLRETQVSQLGALAGTAAGAGLGVIRLTLPMFLGGGLFILLAGVLALAMPETNFNPVRHAGQSRLGQMTATLRAGVKVVRRRPDLRALIGIGFFFGLYSEGFDRLWQAHLLDLFEFSGLPPVVWFGLISAAGMLLSAWAAGAAAQRFHSAAPAKTARALGWISAGMAVGLLAFALAVNLPLAVAAYLVVSILRSLVDPLVTGWINQGLEPQIRATVLSMRSQLDALGQISGGPAIGWIARRSGYRAGLLAATMLLSPVLALLHGVIKKRSPL